MTEEADPVVSQPADPAAPDSKRSLYARLRGVWDLEFAQLRWRILFFTQLARLLPEGRGVPLRTAFVRAMGFSIGAGTRFLGMPKIQSAPGGSLKARLRIGEHCTFGRRTILEFAEVITIGDRVKLADGVVILTTTHQLGPREHRAGPVVVMPVVIGNDVVIGENAIVLPGTIVGDKARVAPNSVVNAKVAPGVTVSGIPARAQRPA
jgi:acetyltransferase-like isoleucine patch superfamily enzyme